MKTQSQAGLRLREPQQKSNFTIQFEYQKNRLRIIHTLQTSWNKRKSKIRIKKLKLLHFSQNLFKIVCNIKHLKMTALQKPQTDTQRIFHPTMKTLEALHTEVDQVSDPQQKLKSLYNQNTDETQVMSIFDLIMPRSTFFLLNQDLKFPMFQATTNHSEISKQLKQSSYPKLRNPNRSQSKSRNPDEARLEQQILQLQSSQALSTCQTQITCSIHQ